VDQSKKHAAGWISFYWGQTPEELEAKSAKTLGEAIQRDWLKLFKRRAQQWEGEAPAEP
jgi:hypothetical protein